MASPPDHTLQILEISRVGPPPNSVTQSSLPLNFFDVFCLPGPAVKHLFFYESTHPKTHFTDTILPKLKRSLSLTLQLFYPLAGNVTHSPESPGKLLLRYLEGDSIELTVAESDAEFHQFVQNSSRDITTEHPLAPDLTKPDTSLTPVLGLQVTHFPGSGFCIGITMHHIAADFRCCLHFMKSWASICRFGDALSLDSVPLYDRSAIKDPNGLYTIFYDQWMKFIGEMGSFEVKERNRVDSVLSTFVLKRVDIERLRRVVLARRLGGGGGDNSNSVPSTFALTCAYAWSCLAKARRDIGPDTEHFVFAADFRPRMDPPLPESYFGNCIATRFVETKGSDLVGEDGIGIASEGIRAAVRGLGNGVLKGAEDWIPKLDRIKGDMFAVAGAPIFRVYDIDFGWGKPGKVEMVSMRDTNAMFLTENRDEEEGGVAFDLARPKQEMDAFASVFREGLKDEEKKISASGSHSIFYGTGTESLSNRRADRSPLTSRFFGSTSTRHYSTSSIGIFPAIFPTRRYSIGISPAGVTSPGSTSIGISNKEHVGTDRIYAERSFSFCRENLHRPIGYFWRTFRHVLTLNRGRRMGSLSAVDF